MKKIFLSLMVATSLSFAYTDTEQDNLIDSNRSDIEILNDSISLNSFLTEENREAIFGNNVIGGDTGGDFGGGFGEYKKGLLKEIYGVEEETIIDPFTGDITTIEAEDGLIDKVQYNTNDIAELKNKDTELENRIDTNEVNILNNTNDITTLKNKDIELENSIFSNRVDIQKNTNDIATLNNNNNIIIDSVNTNTNTLKIHNTRLDNHNSRITNNEKRLSKLEEQLAKNDDIVNQKIASSMASSLNYDFSNGNKSIAYTIANFNGKSAFGFGYAYRYNNAVFSFSSGFDTDNLAIKLNATTSF